MMRGKFQMNSIQYGELPKQYSYHTEGPWKLYRWNLGDSAKPQRCVKATPKKLFSSTTTASVISAKFQAILLDFWNFQKFRDKKEIGKMLESHAISSNLSVVHHKWPKVSFLIKRQWFDDAWKVSNEFDSIWSIAKTTELPHRRSLKAIYVKSWRLCKITKMCEGYSKLTFFINDNSFGHLCKVSSHFVGLLKLSKIQGQKRNW